MSITVYSTPDCVQCKATYRELERQGLDYTVLNIREDAAAHEAVVALGYRQLPVVKAGDAHWSGYQPDKIKALA